MEAGGIEPPSGTDVTLSPIGTSGSIGEACAADTLQTSGVNRPELASADPRLAAVAAAWDSLPEPIRAAIGTLVDSAGGSAQRPADGGG